MRRLALSPVVGFAVVLVLSPGLGCSPDDTVVPDDGGMPPACTQHCIKPALSRLDLVAGQPGGPGYVDGPLAQAHFLSPTGVACDGAGHLYVTDAGNTVRAIDLAAEKVSTLAGAPEVNGGMDGTGSGASFYGSTNVLWRAGILYVADTENHTIRQVDTASGAVLTVAGAYGMGGTDDGPAAMARFQEPEGLTVVGDDLYIGDTDNHTLRRMNLGTRKVSTVAGAARMPGNVDGASAVARFNKPKALASDGVSSVFVLESGNHSLRQVAVADGAVSTLATFPVEPQGIAVIGSDVYVSLLDHRIVRVAIAGGAVTPVAGKALEADFVDGALADARFSFPAGLCSDGKSALYVGDGNAVLRKIDLMAAQVSTVAGAKASGSSDGVGMAARFRGPAGITTDAAGVAYVADTINYTLRRVELSTGAVTTLAGTAGQSGKVDGIGAAARFYLPMGVALDGAGKLYVADAGNKAIRVVDVASAEVSTLAGAVFRTPCGVAYDGAGSGHLYVTDREDQTVRAIDLATHEVSELAGRAFSSDYRDGIGDKARFSAPCGIVSDGAGTLYVADVLNQAVRKVVIATGEVSTLAGGGSKLSDGTAFSFPSYLTLNGRGDLFVSDVNNNLVRHFDVHTAAVTTVVGSRQRSGVKLGPLPAQIASLSAITLTEDGQLVLLAESSVLLAH